jgi:tryptophanyl-tRNA synthetase
VDCKLKLADGVIQYFAPLRERRAKYEKDPARLDDIIRTGCQRAREVAARTMTAVHEAMGIG